MFDGVECNDCTAKHSKAEQRNAAHGKARQGAVLNRGQPLGNRGLIEGQSLKSMAEHRRARHGKASQGTVLNRVQPLGNRGLIEGQSSNAPHRRAEHRKALKGSVLNRGQRLHPRVLIEGQSSNASQCKVAHCNAMHRKAAHGTAKRLAPWQQGAIRWAVPPTTGENEMTMQSAKIKVTGINPLLQNNPQTVDPFNRYAKLKKAITNKRTGKTEDDLIELGNLETESKIYFNDSLGVYVPATWLTESIITTGYAVAKIGRAKMRGGLFATENKVKLNYKGMNKVNTIADVVMNPEFRQRMILPQQNVRVPKDFPIFENWSFETTLEFDDAVIDFNTLKRVVQHAAKYGGFGDFRPTFGRATAEVTCE